MIHSGLDVKIQDKWKLNIPPKIKHYYAYNFLYRYCLCAVSLNPL